MPDWTCRSKKRALVKFEGRNIGTRSSGGGHNFVSPPSRRYPQSGALSRVWPCGSVSGKTRCARGAWRCCKLDRFASRLSRRAVAKARTEKWLLEPRQGAKVTPSDPLQHDSAWSRSFVLLVKSPMHVTAHPYLPEGIGVR